MQQCNIARASTQSVLCVVLQGRKVVLVGSDKRGSSGRAGIDNLLSHAADKSGREPGRQGPLQSEAGRQHGCRSASPPALRQIRPPMERLPRQCHRNIQVGEWVRCKCHACLQAAAAGRATCRRDTHVCWRKAGKGKRHMMECTQCKIIQHRL